MMRWYEVISGVTGFQASSSRAGVGTVAIGYTIGVNQNQTGRATTTTWLSAEKKTLVTPTARPSGAASTCSTNSSGTIAISTLPGQPPVDTKNARNSPQTIAKFTVADK